MPKNLATAVLDTHENAIPLLALEANGFTIRSHNLDLGFDRMFRRQWSKTPTRIANSYPNFWATFLCDCPEDTPIYLRYRRQVFKFSGRCGIYIPMCTLVEWELPTGWSEWITYVSVRAPHNEFPSTPTFFRFAEFPMITTFDDLLAFMKAHLKTHTFHSLPTKTSLPKHHERVMAYLNANYRASINIRDVVRALNISQSTVSHTFRAAYGITPIEYLQIVRVFGTLIDIGAGQHITKVIYDHGYKNYPTFYRQFIKVLGYSPSVYARRGFAPLEPDVDLKTIRTGILQKM